MEACISCCFQSWPIVREIGDGRPCAAQAWSDHDALCWADDRARPSNEGCNDRVVPVCVTGAEVSKVSRSRSIAPAMTMPWKQTGVAGRSSAHLPQGDDSERAALLSVPFVVSPVRKIRTFARCSVPCLQACQPGLVLQALKQALDAHKAGRGHLHELEQGMRSDEQAQLGNWATIAEQLPLWSGDDVGIEWLWLCSDGSPLETFVCVKVRLKAALVLLAQQNIVTERNSNQDRLAIH